MALVWFRLVNSDGTEVYPGASVFSVTRDGLERFRDAVDEAYKSVLFARGIVKKRVVVYATAAALRESAPLSLDTLLSDLGCDSENPLVFCVRAVPPLAEWQSVLDYVEVVDSSDKLRYPEQSRLF